MPRSVSPPRPSRFRFFGHTGPAALAVLTALVLLAPAAPAAAQAQEDPGHDHPPMDRPEPMEEHHAAMHSEVSVHPEAGGTGSSESCVSDCDCPSGELCSPDTATCRPAICPKIYRPVCGLDGRTYGNECAARAAHVVVAHPGECAKTCGGIAGEPCPEGQVCDLPAGMCDGRDLQGECKPRPKVCIDLYDPVCGCDGTTYGNDCERLRAGAQKAYDGRCRDGDDQPPVCASNDDCPRRAYCQFPVGACQGKGRCEPRPDVCPQIFMPVCGCDGQTYSNSCTAASHGVSVAHDGRCTG